MKKRRLFDETTQMNQSPRSMQLIRSLLALLIVVTTARGAEPESPPPRVMTLVDCIQAALQYNLGLQIARYGPQIARYNLGVSYAAYDPTYSFSGEHDYSLTPGGIDAQNRAFSGQAWVVSVRRNLPRAGGESSAVPFSHLAA